MSAPLQRTPRDLIATGVVSAVSLLAVVGVWATAPIRSAELTPAAEEVSVEEQLLEVPAGLVKSFTLDSSTLPGQHRPLVAGGLLISNDGHNVFAHDPAGEEVWRYERDREICGIGTAWQAVTIAYRNNAGCGDAVSITASSGEYKSTRSAPAPDEVVMTTSNDRVGIANEERVELWRSDLVRTVEYGDVPAPQEANQQPHADCTITSALTRTELLAVTEQCPDGTWLRLQDTTPEDARKPEITQNIQLEDPASRLVAIGQSDVAVHTGSQILAINGEGETTQRLISPKLDVAGFYSPATADLPNHMSWFEGNRLYLFDPAGLKVTQVFMDAIGTGIVVGDKLLYPVENGISVTDPIFGVQEKILPVQRGAHTGEVSLALAGGTIVEKRGEQLVGLVQAP